jgi:peptide/nickel transport system permease protein
MGLMPGDPLDLACQANPYCTPENLEVMKKNLGLDQPIYVRYFDWLGSFLTGDFGYSRTYQRPVAEILGPRLVNTLILALASIVISLVIAVPLGVFTGLRPGSKWDYSINMLAFIGISIPSFWFGLMLIIIFSVWLGWFPASGVETIGGGTMTFWEMVKDRTSYLVLPLLALSCMTIAQWVRFTRSSMMETMRFDFIRTARAKGLTEGRVVFFHGLRNALIPVVTVVAVSLSFVFSGAIITETVFAYQGAGKLIFDAIIGNDYNLAMCSFIITCCAVLLMNLVADICYGYLDPRISYK